MRSNLGEGKPKCSKAREGNGWLYPKYTLSKNFQKKNKKKFKKFLPHKKTPKENKKGLKEIAKV